MEYLYKFNARKMINTITEKKIIGCPSELFNNGETMRQKIKIEKH
jgi:hypothetical protein